MFRKFRSVSNKFNPLERTLLTELQKCLHPKYTDLLTKQLKDINLIQRHSNSREICCYTIKNGKVFNNPEYQILTDKLEYKFASIEFLKPVNDKKWRADFFLVRGYFFSININPSPIQISNSDKIIIVSVTDLSESEESRSEIVTELNEGYSFCFPEWLRVFAEHVKSDINTCEASLPLNDIGRKKILSEIDVNLPLDYLELTKVCDGLFIGEWIIYGLKDIYEVILDEGSYIVLAERAGRGVIVANNNKYYYYDYDSPNPLIVSELLQRVLIQSSSL